MCGICGVIDFRGKPVERAFLERACAALRHRGPDDSGTWIDNSTPCAAFGATRLAILDPSPAGHQPMHRAGRFTLVFNGEVYNFRDVRHELAQAGEQFKTESDTETILAACAKWGPDALSRFNGMWALCFYDRQSKSGFMARDRFGVKPLLYSAPAARLVFASEMPALMTLPSDTGRSIDRASLVHHLMFGYIAHPATIYSAVRRLPPGHFLSWSPQGPAAPVRFYDPIADALGEPPTLGAETTIRHGPHSASEDSNYGEVRSELRSRIARAVTTRLVSDVPLGAFLSGGLDSSIIVKHAAEATSARVTTFAVGYENQRAYDERRYARMVARCFDTDHHEVVVSDRQAVEAIPAVLDHLGEPFGDSSIIPASLVSQFAARSVKVALSGDGGDELFAGYWRYSAHSVLDNYLRLPALLRGLIEPVLLSMGTAKSSGMANRVRQFRKMLRAPKQDALSRHVAWSRVLAPEAAEVLRDASECETAIRIVTAIAAQLTDVIPRRDTLNRILAFDLQYQLPADMLHKVDLASMMHSLEVRVPFLDPSVVEFALRLPSELKFFRGQRKRILTDAYRGQLPDEILDRPKQGFEIPIGEFLRGPLRDVFQSVVNRDTIDSLGVLSLRGVESVYEDHLARRSEHADLLFAILSLCWWYNRRRAADS